MTELEAYPFLTLDLDIGPTHFSDIDELQAWVNEEVNAFEWIIQAESNSQAPVWPSISAWLNVLSTFISGYASTEDEQRRVDLTRQLKVDVERYHKNANVKSSNSADAQFVFGLRLTSSDSVAAYALGHLMARGINSYTADAIEGVFLALQYKRGSPDTVLAEKKELEALKVRWGMLFRNQLSDSKGKEEQWAAKVAEYEEAFTATGQKFKAFYDAEEERFQRLSEMIQNEFSDLSAAYKEHMLLESSVTYWTDKQEHHRKEMKHMALATLLLGVLSLGIFVCIAKASELTIGTVNNVPLGQLGILIAITAAGIWITRLCAKLSISNLHLNTEARERVTMMKTYIALVSEGKAPLESDRSLMLQTLFRPSSAGLIKEDGPAGFLELLKWIKKE